MGWAGSFEPTSINHMAHSWTSDVYSAQLKSDPSFHVVFKAMHIHDPKAKREMHMRRRLSDMGDLGLIRAGNIVPLLDSETSEDAPGGGGGCGLGKGGPRLETCDGLIGPLSFLASERSCDSPPGRPGRGR